MTKNGSEWLTVKEAAELSGYNAEYLRRLIREEKLEYRKVSFIYQINKTSLSEYLKHAVIATDKRYSPKHKK